MIQGLEHAGDKVNLDEQIIIKHTLYVTNSNWHPIFSAINKAEDLNEGDRKFSNNQNLTGDVVRLVTESIMIFISRS
jgi:hypothetical protein